MQMNLIGFRHNVGTFEGKDYDNYKLFVSYEPLNPNIVGEEINTLKVSKHIFENYLNSCLDLNDALGSVNIELGFNNIVSKVSKG